MEEARITPILVRIERLKPAISAHRHSKEGYEFHYTESGSGRAIVDDQVLEIKKGMLYVTGPGIVHEQYSNENDPIIEYCLYLECSRIQTGSPGVVRLFLDTHYWMGEDQEHVYNLLRRLIEENRNHDIDTELMSEALIRQIIILITRMYRHGISNHRSTQTFFKNMSISYMPMIDDAFCYQYQNLTLSSLANMLDLSVRQTQRLLKKNYGKTFTQKLTEARTAAATSMLSNTNMSITEISERLGYSSIEYFSNVFRRVMGMSPRDYRLNKSS